MVRFDATKLLPKHMFNATLEDIRELRLGRPFNKVFSCFVRFFMVFPFNAELR